MKSKHQKTGSFGEMPETAARAERIRRMRASNCQILPKRAFWINSLRVTGFCRKDLSDLLPEGRTSILSRTPHLIPVDPEISVNQNVAEGNDLRPGYSGLTAFQCCGNARGRFADDSQLLNHRASDQLGLSKFFKSDTSDEFGDCGAGYEKTK